MNKFVYEASHKSNLSHYHREFFSSLELAKSYIETLFSQHTYNDWKKLDWDQGEFWELRVPERFGEYAHIRSYALDSPKRKLIDEL